MALYHCSLLRRLEVLNLRLQASHTLLISSTWLLLCPLLTPFFNQSHCKQGLTHLGGLPSVENILAWIPCPPHLIILPTFARSFGQNLNSYFPLFPQECE